MNDMIVRLYDLPDAAEDIKAFREKGVVVKRAMSLEKRIVVKWVEETFGQWWGPETETAFDNSPPTCFIASKGKELLGFAVYDATCKNFFGPTGVTEKHRGNGIGRVLMLSAFHAMRNDGYAYGIIGSAGPVDFYKKVLDAQVIEKSVPGVYEDLLRN
ncbi:MAG: GNAT family N-acetyltransferase [Sedimentisphaeraceae bacterium JB056]